MRLLIFLFVFVFQTIIFAQNIPTEDSIQKRQESERIQMFKKLLKQYKELCSKDSIRAVNDSKTQNKFYIFNSVPSGDDFPAKNELQDILKNNNVLWGGIGSGSDIPLHYTTDKCYSSYMNFFTEEKFGKDFINGLVKQALLQYIEKRPAIILSYNEHLDWIYENNNKIADDLINILFHKTFLYPKDYHHSLDEISYSEVKLVLNRENYIMDVENFVHHIEDKANKRFIPYFEKSIKNFIKSHNLNPTKEDVLYSGFKNTFRIYYK